MKKVGISVTPEVFEQMVGLYTIEEKTMTEIAEILGTTRTTVSRHLERAGYYSTRKSNKLGKIRHRSCDCGKINPPESTFCNACGHKLRFSYEKLMGDLMELYRGEKSLPESERDFHHKTIERAINFIRKAAIDGYAKD